DGSWQRVFEGLIPGVQGKPTGLLDLHTQGKAMDLGIGDEDQPITPEMIKKILAVSKSNDLVMVAHAYFIHSHMKGPERYFVDRTATYALAKRLFPGEYDKYPRNECTMFDVPLTTGITLVEKGDGVRLEAQTANGQTWTFTWTGVGADGLLVGKT